MNALKKQFPYPAEKPMVPANHHGWLSECNKQVLAGRKNINIILEIGSWLGMSARFLCESYPKAQVICVDHWQGSSEHIRDYPEYLPTLYETFIVNCWKYRDRITPVKLRSLDAIELISSLDIEPDLVYIDGSHDFLSVFADLEMCYINFKNAQIVGDDWHIEDVRNVVEFFCQIFGIDYEVTTDTWEIVR